MEKRIWKITLKPEFEQEIKVPAGSKFLSVKTQNDRVVFYAMVGPFFALFDTYRIWLVETGKPITFDATYAGTVMLFKDSYVLHAFYRKQ